MGLSESAPRTVPEGSEPIGTVGGSESRSGRRPLLSDQALLKAARTLNQQLHRLPTASEVIEFTGGCQKQRALRSIQQLRVELAEKVVRSRIAIPNAMRVDLEDFARRLLDRAAEQLAEQQAAAELEHAQRLLVAREEVEQLAVEVQSLRAELANAERTQQELLTAQRQLQSDLDEAKVRAHRSSAVSEERQRLLNHLLLSRSTPNSACGD